MVIGRPSRRGFTLVELIVASVVAVVVTAATTTAVSQVLRVRTRSAANHQASSRADAAAVRIALDIAGAVRHNELTFTRVAVADSGTSGQARDELLLLARSLQPVRAREESADGGVYEVQYRIAPSGLDRAGSSLWRRCDAAFDLALDGGGIASPIVDGVVGLSIQANNGTDWFDAWDSDADGMPHGVRVTVTAQSDDGSATAVARRVVALDRTPLPPAVEEPADGETDDGATPTTPSTGTGTTTTTPGSTGGTPGRTVTTPGPRSGTPGSGGTPGPGGGNPGTGRDPGSTGPNPGRPGGGGTR